MGYAGFRGGGANEETVHKDFLGLRFAWSSLGKYNSHE